MQHWIYKIVSLHHVSLLLLFPWTLTHNEVAVWPNITQTLQLRLFFLPVHYVDIDLHLTWTHLRDAQENPALSHCAALATFSPFIKAHWGLITHHSKQQAAAAAAAARASDTTVHTRHHEFLPRDFCCSSLGSLRGRILLPSRAARCMCGCTQQLPGAQPHRQNCITGGRCYFTLFILMLFLICKWTYLKLLKAKTHKKSIRNKKKIRQHQLLILYYIKNIYD